MSRTKKARHLLYDLPGLFKKSARELLANDPLRLAGATAFFTSFALPPIMIILFQVLRLVLNPATIRMELFKSLSSIIGPETVRELAGVSVQWRRLAQNWYVTVAGFIFLLFVATTLFKVIRNSLNQVWKFRSRDRKRIRRVVRGRFQSFFVIVMAGILLLVSVIADGLQAFIGNYLAEISPLLSFYFDSALHYLLSLAMVTLWFTMLFRYLPDGRPDWRTAFTGGFLTGLLFTLGRLVLRWLLSYSNINTLYGTSTSIVLLLLFVFYSSIILYFGGAFTKIWGDYVGRPIQPLPHAVRYRLTETAEE